MTTELSAIDRVPRPMPAGAEMAALARFHFDSVWTGSVQEGGMGPGTPTMIAHGGGTHETIQDGRWIVGNYWQDQLLPDETFVLKWQLHWVAGWDPLNGEYRATIADCYGHAEVMRGRIEGERLTFESMGDGPVRLRLTWELRSPNEIEWRNEMSIAGDPWSLVETYHCTRA